MSTRDEAIRFLNLELQARSDHDLVPAIVDILVANPDLCLSLIWENQNARNGILQQTAAVGSDDK